VLGGNPPQLMKGANLVAFVGRIRDSMAKISNSHGR